MLLQCVLAIKLIVNHWPLVVIFITDILGRCKLNSKLSLFTLHFLYKNLSLVYLTFIIKKLYLCPQLFFLMKKENTKETFKVGDIVEVSPNLTLLKEWIKGKIIKIRQNPFIGTEIAIKDDQGRIFFGEKEFFKPVL